MILDNFLFGKHLEKGESVLYSVRQHWVVILKPALEVGFFGFAVPWGLYFMGFNSPLFFWVALAWSAIAYIRFMYVLMFWYGNAWLVTDMSMIVVQFNGFFSNTGGRTGYEDIEGAGYEIKGFWPSVLRYGDLSLKLMSGNCFSMPKAASPRKAELAIAQYQDHYMTAREMRDQSTLKSLLSGMVTTYMKKKVK